MTFTSAATALIEGPELSFQTVAAPAPAAEGEVVKNMRDTQQQQYINHDLQDTRNQQAMMQQRQQ